MKLFLFTLSISALVAVAFSNDEDELIDKLETNKDDLQDIKKNITIPSTNKASSGSKKDKSDDDSERAIVYGTEAPVKETKGEKQEKESDDSNDYHGPVFNHKEHGKIDLHRPPPHHKENDNNDVHKHGPPPHHVDHDSKVSFQHGPPPRRDRKPKGLNKSSKLGEIDKSGVKRQSSVE